MGTSSFVGNEQRHAHIIAAWKLAQSSPHTLRAYSRSMADFCSWLDAKQMDLLTVKPPVIDGFRHTLTGLAPATVAARIAALSSFYRYAVSAEAILGGNPVELVKRPRMDAAHSGTEGMTKDQARTLLAAARADGLRSHALLPILLFTGIRLSEGRSKSPDAGLRCTFMSCQERLAPYAGTRTKSGGSARKRYENGRGEECQG